MLLSAYMLIFGYSPLKIQCTAVLLDRMNLKNWGASAPSPQPHLLGLVCSRFWCDWIGARVSEPLSSDLNMNFICLSVCLSWMDHQITSGSYFGRFASCANSKTTRELKTWTMDGLTPQWR